MGDQKERLRQKYTVAGHAIDPNGENIEADCVDILIVNYGTSIVRINNYLRIPPPTTAGQFVAFTIKGNTGELDKTTYQISFDAGGGGLVNDAVIMWRNYTD